MVNIINGKQLAEKIKDEIVSQLVKLRGSRPNLAIILVGDRPDAQLYVKLKKEEAKKVGIDTHLYKCPAAISQSELLAMIEYLNHDDLIDGILVQLPLPDKFETNQIIAAIDPAKDVDGFHPVNLEKLFVSCNQAEVIPPVFQVVLEILKSINYKVADKQICIIANSEIFGKSLARVLACQGAKVEIVKVDDKDLVSKACLADVLITAVGRPKFLKKQMVKPEAVVIDIGITKKGRRVYGDVDFKQVKKQAGYLTPVPGGVGPLTVAMVLRNTLELYKRRHNLK